MSEVAYKLDSERSDRFELPTGALGVALHAEKPLAYAACVDGVYELSLKWGESRLLYTHGSYVSNVVFDRKHHRLISSGYDGALRWYDLQENQVIRTVQAHRFWSWDLAIASDSQVVASSTGQYLAGDYEYRPRPADEPCVRVFDTESGEEISQFEFGPPAQCVALSADGKYVAAGNLMGDAAVWKVGGERVAAWNTPDFTAFGIIKSHCQIGGLYATAFAPDNSLLVAGMGPMRDPMAGNGKQRWQRFDWLDLAEAKKLSQSNDGQVGEGLMETLAFHPSGKYFVMAGRLRGGSWSTALFDLASGELLHSIKSGSRVTKAVFSDDGNTLYLAGAKKQKQDTKYDFGVVDVYEIEESAAES